MAKYTESLMHYFNRYLSAYTDSIQYGIHGFFSGSHCLVV